jgi:hypothetical protein
MSEWPGDPLGHNSPVPPTEASEPADSQSPFSDNVTGTWKIGLNSTTSRNSGRETA